MPLASRTIFQMDQATSGNKAFFGTSIDNVKTQIWIARAVFLLIAIIKKRLTLELSLCTILQILSVSLFEKTPFYQALSDTSLVFEQYEFDEQLNLFIVYLDTKDEVHNSTYE